VTKIIAHRGASRVEPENTLAAFRAARRLGADLVELDVRLTADGELAVQHDAVLPDGRPVATVAASSLPAHVPLLAAALDACEGMGVNVEIKNEPGEIGYDPDAAVATAVVELVVRRDEIERVVVSSFDLATIDRVHQAEPGIETAWLVMTIDDATLDTLTEHGHFTVHPWHGSTTEEVVAQCHRAGVRVNVWTCDEPDHIRQFARWSVAGICTNVPDLARQILFGQKPAV
jgi:glycerophosphoryl diester phosphodiesterase